jgi:uncharacterized protein (TIGR03083 family)
MTPPERRRASRPLTPNRPGPIIPRSPAPDQILPSQLLLRTEGPCDLDPGRLLEVFGRQRQRFAAVLRGFGPGDWAAPTRCTDWSAHHVVRHLCDGNAIIKAWVTGTGHSTLDVTAGFDPRITPRTWPAVSASESPGATLSRFVATTGELLTLTRARLTQNRSFDIRLPYGPMAWTVGILHAFWDSWLHERDILLARGREHPTDGDATLYATAYGVFIATAVASMYGDQVQEKLTLGGDGGGVFDLEARGGVTLTVTRATTTGSPAANVTDALGGRAPIAAVLGGLPASSRAALSRMADFFNTPARQSPA